MKNFLIIFFCALSVIVNAQITGGSKIKTTTSSGIVTVTMDSVSAYNSRNLGNQAVIGAANDTFLTTLNGQVRKVKVTANDSISGNNPYLRALSISQVNNPNLHICFLGDSRTEYQYTPRALRYLFLNKYKNKQFRGMGYAGIGRCVWENSTETLSNTLKVENVGDALLSSNGTIMRIAPAGFIQYNLTNDTLNYFTSIDFSYINNRGAFNILIDGVVKANVTTSGTTVINKVSISGLTDTTHIIKILSTGTDSCVVTEMFATRKPNGIIISRIGHGGYTSGQIFNIVKTQTNFYSSYLPDLVVIRVGLNDIRNGYLADGTGTATYIDSIAQQIKLVSPNTSFLILSETDAGSITKINTVPTVLAVRKMCNLKNYAFLNLYDIIPNWITFNTQGLGDTIVHENQNGATLVIAPSIYNFLIYSNQNGYSISTLDSVWKINGNKTYTTANVQSTSLTATQGLTLTGLSDVRPNLLLLNTTGNAFVASGIGDYNVPTISPSQGVINSSIISSGGVVGIGGALASLNTNSKLHIVKSSAGTYTLIDELNTVTVEATGANGNGIQFKTPVTGYAGLGFSSPSQTFTAAYMVHQYNTGQMTLGTNQSTGNLSLRSGGFTERINISNTGDIKFNAFTGTSRRLLTVDASGIVAPTPLDLVQGTLSDNIVSDSAGVLRHLSINSLLTNTWTLTGNAGTTAGTNFIGTTDATDLVFKTNNTEKLRVLSGGNVGIGTTSPTKLLEVNGDIKVNGLTVGLGNGNIASNIVIGFQAGYSNTTGNNNSFIGYQAGFSNTTGYNNSFLGFQTGYNNTTGVNNSFSGFQAGLSNTIGSNNLYLGYNAGGINISGSSNTYLGVQSTGVTNGSSRSNMLAIGTYSNGTYIFGDSTGAIGIGTTTPAYKLDVLSSANPIRLQGLQSGAATDLIVTSASGVLRTQTAAQILNANAWTLTGNAGTTGTNFIGTTDATNFLIKTNNTERMRVLSNGIVGIGTVAPISKLSVLDINNNFCASFGGNGANPNVLAIGTVSTVPSIQGFNNSLGSYNDISLQSYGGSVGIGTTSPAYKLDVNATSNPLRLQGLAAGASTDDVLSSSGGVVTKNTLGNLNFTNNIYGAGNSYQSQIGKQYVSYISDTLLGTTYLNRNSVNDYGFVGFYKNGTAQTYNINYYNLLSYDISEKTQYNGLGITTNVNKASKTTGTTFYQYSNSVGLNLYDTNNNAGTVSFDSLNLNLKGANNLAYNIKADSLIVKPLTGINFQGVKYAADYSTNYTTRSLVDKAYVDAKFSNTTFTTYNSAIASGTETTIAITVTGLTTSGEVSSSFSGTKPQGLIVMPVEKSANTVTFHLYNATGASITPNITLSATVLKY